MNRHIAYRAIVITLAAALAACSSMREGMERHKDAVAVAEGYALTIDHAAELITMAPESVAPTNFLVIDRTVDLWTSYAVLGTEFRKENRFADLDIEPLTRFGTQQELVWRLRDQVVRDRILPDEATLREWYMRDQPLTRVRTSHLLLRVADDASEAEVESKRQLAGRLRERILAGEAFAELARTYSEDPSSAPAGGDRGWVPRGRLLPELEVVVFNLEVGEISEVLRTTFGFHIITVTERDVPDFEYAREGYEEDLIRDGIAAVEESYVDSVATASDIRITPGSVNLVRRSAFSARLARLGTAERSAALARFSGGVLTYGDWADFVVKGGPNTQGSFAGSDSANVAELLSLLAMNEVLSSTAIRAGHEISEHASDSIRAAALSDLRIAALSAGFRPDTTGDPYYVQSGVDRAFDMMLVRNRSARPLDRVSPALKRNGPAVLVHPYRYRKVMERLAELRAAAQPAAPGRSGPANEEAGSGS